MSSTAVRSEVDQFMKRVEARSQHEPEFHQAVREVIESVMPVVLDDKRLRDASILERVVEPDRVVSFRVAWEDDSGKVQVNRGYRVQFSRAIGPYKGGLRFHPTVNQSVLKFLGFEQIFKNSLTGLAMGGGKGGADFDPKGKSDREVMRFCQAFMTELSKYIGEDVDVPAGDIGVGGREIGFLYGQWVKMTGRPTGVLTGKPLMLGGSLIRPEATGFGLVYFAEHAMKNIGESLEGKRVAISGSGNVAIYAMRKCLDLGAKVVTFSDSSGLVHDRDGVDEEKWAFLRELKEVRRGRVGEYAERFSKNVSFHAGEEPWGVECDVALPCATQNELGADEAKQLVKNGVRLVGEGANMPTTPEATEHLQQSKVLFCPGKAANAGGVGVSGLEMSQNAQRLSWTREEVDGKLGEIMERIHEACVEHGSGGEVVDYVRGANVAGFMKVAEAILAQGVG